MKFLFRLLLAALIAVGILWFGVTRGLPVFLADMLRVHGAAMTGSAMAVQDMTVAWENRRAIFSGIDLFPVGDYAATGSPIARVGQLAHQLPVTFMPEPAAATMMPEVLALDAVVAANIELSYDVDTVGGNLRLLRQQLSVAASESLRDRLNVREGDKMTRQLFVVRRLLLQDLTINAQSLENPEKSRRFSVGSIEFANMGANENGMTAAEILDQSSRKLVDEIQRQAILQGVIEPRREADARAARGGVQASGDAGDNAAVQKEENRVKKAAKQVKEGFQDLGRGIKRGFREIVD
jgi:hypothetical protein